jgi:hypothetical protein
MMQHVEQGRRTEIDALNGALVREARALGIAVPYNEAIVAVVKGLEKSRRQRLRTADRLRQARGRSGKGSKEKVRRRPPAGTPGPL